MLVQKVETGVQFSLFVYFNLQTQTWTFTVISGVTNRIRVLFSRLYNIHVIVDDYLGLEDQPELNYF